MVFLLIHIPAYKQLATVNPEILESVLRTVRLEIGDCCDELPSITGSLVFVSGDSNKQLARLARGAYVTFRRFSERRDEL